MSDAPLSDCPSCEQPKLRKKISAAGFRLKGTGWYETDFKTGKKKNLVKSDNEKRASSDKIKPDDKKEKKEKKEVKKENKKTTDVS